MKKKNLAIRKLSLNKSEISNLTFNSVTGGGTLTNCFSCDANDCESDGTHCDCGTIRCGDDNDSRGCQSDTYLSVEGCSRYICS